ERREYPFSRQNCAPWRAILSRKASGFGFYLDDAGDAVLEDALDPGLESHHREGAATAGSHHLERDHPVFDALEDDVTAVHLDGGTDVVEGGLEQVHVDLGVGGNRRVDPDGDCFGGGGI